VLSARTAYGPPSTQEALKGTVSQSLAVQVYSIRTESKKNAYIGTKTAKSYGASRV